MAASRTMGEHTAAELVGRPGSGRGKAMDFSSHSEVSSDDVTAGASARQKGPLQQDRRPSGPRGHHRRDARCAPDRVRQGHAPRPLSAARRNQPGPLRPGRLGLCRRRRPRPARLRLYLQAVVHAGDPGAVQRRHRPRPADQLLFEQRLRQPRRHRQHLERECLAGLEGRRHRHLLGRGARHRRAGRPQRQDQRHHPVRPRDGQPDAGDFAGLAAARLGGRLPRHLAPRDRGVPRDPQAVRRLQPQGAQPPPRRAHHRRVHGGRARRRRVRAALTPRRVGAGHGRCAVAVPEAGRDPPGDRRAVHHLHRPGEQDDAQASPRPGPQGVDLQPVLGDHAADRQGSSRRRPHRGLLPVVAEPRDLGPVERRQVVHRGRHALPRQCADRLHRPRARRDGPRQVQRRCASGRSALA